MSDTDEKILKALEDLQADVKGLKGDVAGIKSEVSSLKTDVESLKADVTAVQADVTAVKDAQQSQGKRLTALEAGQIALDLKVEAIHDYQKKAHTEIMGHLVDTTEMSDRDHKALVKRVERIEKHVDLPPVKEPPLLPLDSKPRPPPVSISFIIPDLISFLKVVALPGSGSRGLDCPLRLAS